MRNASAAADNIAWFHRRCTQGRPHLTKQAEQDIVEYVRWQQELREMVEIGVSWRLVVRDGTTWR